MLAPSRGRRWRGGACSFVPLPAASLRAGVVDLEVVELPRGAVAPEVRRVEREACAVEQRAQLGDVALSELLLDAVGAEPGDGSAHVDVRLVDRITECVAGVAADDETSALRHERAHVTD